MKNMNKSKGFTLIEYMVAITVGLILIAGVGTFFVGMKQSTLAQNGIAELQENGRFGLYFLTNDIQKAGWKDPAGGVVGSTTDNYMDLTGISDGATDSIKVRYESEFDCLGAATAGGIAENRFFVEDGELKCQGANSTQPIITGVDALHFTYGVDLNKDSMADKYVNGTDLAATPKDAKKVVSVKIVLLLASSSDVAKAASAKTFKIPGETDFTSAKDRKLRKLFSTTVYIPNKPKTVGI